MNTYLIANWKMHGHRAQVQDYAFRVNAALSSAPKHLITVFCPPANYIDAASQALPLNARLTIGAQNCHTHASGAYTGEIAVPMLADCGALAVIVGHSERRTYFAETDALVEQKARAVAAAGLTPIVCIGESLEEYEAGKTAAVLEKQLEAYAAQPIDGMLVAYEPVWAIGSGKTPSGAEIAAAHAKIKSMLGSAISVLYGGSVKPANLAEILEIEGVNGALIGGASLDAAGMIEMIATVK